MGLWWLGQSSYALKNSAGEIIYIDPYLTDVISPLSYIMHTRLIAPVVAPDAGVDVLAVLITHDHLDHLDPNSAVMLAANAKTTFYGSGDVVHKLVDVLDVLRLVSSRSLKSPNFEVGHYTIHTTKAVHGGGAVGYVIDVDGVTLYFSGDTVLFYSMRDIGAAHDIDVAFFCINGQAGNMDILSALHACQPDKPAHSRAKSLWHVCG